MYLTHHSEKSDILESEICPQPAHRYYLPTVHYILLDKSINGVFQKTAEINYTFNIGPIDISFKNVCSNTGLTLL